MVADHAVTEVFCFGFRPVGGDFHCRRRGDRQRVGGFEARLVEGQEHAARINVFELGDEIGEAALFDLVETSEVMVVRRLVFGDQRRFSGWERRIEIDACNTVGRFVWSEGGRDFHPVRQDSLDRGDVRAKGVQPDARMWLVQIEIDLFVAGERVSIRIRHQVQPVSRRTDAGGQLALRDFGLEDGRLCCR